MGKPVIATGYSGNLAFMDEENCLLVPYRTVRVPPGCEPYPVDAEWADPDLDVAARYLRDVWEAPDVARQLGARAREQTSTAALPSEPQSSWLRGSTSFGTSGARGRRKPLSSSCREPAHRSGRALAGARRAPTPPTAPVAVPRRAAGLRRRARRRTPRKSMRSAVAAAIWTDEGELLPHEHTSAHSSAEATEMRRTA